MYDLQALIRTKRSLEKALREGFFSQHTPCVLQTNPRSQPNEANADRTQKRK
jgi:hypothetical protein